MGTTATVNAEALKDLQQLAEDLLNGKIHDTLAMLDDLPSMIRDLTDGVEAPVRRYVVQHRDASALLWHDLEEHRYDVVGEALTACDRLIDGAETFLPRLRYRVVDLHSGEIVVWKATSLSRL